jgi:hypothetical protein
MSDVIEIPDDAEACKELLRELVQKNAEKAAAITHLEELLRINRERLDNTYFGRPVNF